MLKPRRRFQAVVSELIDGLRTGEIRLRDHTEEPRPGPGDAVSGAPEGGAGAGLARPAAGQQVTTPARKKA